MDEVTIEPMSLTHIPAILEIEREVFPTPWTAEMFRQEVVDDRLSRAFVALIGGRLVGYFVAWFLRDEVHLLNIAVTVSHQKRGIGGQILHYLLDMAKRERREVITLEVRESNETAIKFYRSFGFSPIGVRPNYYHDVSEDAILMARYLPIDG